MIINKQLRMGIKAESEHKGTIKFIKDYKKKFGKFPPSRDVYIHIALDHLREDPKYYSKLKKYKL